ncbi:MAG: ankyrin repeat domain-containing protein [Leptospiraceae bacterium]|nr:ankyrin repeat domain-containing protein [Leptospiraceae bacterium]MBK7056577.1 ankyrin repeat domain-containing protein [Leptospiraceae bacterium]MBK9501029.1 ankyrin repeat domain-containing protein [Leptospiraceae bacterium]MBL0264082.1 ankyrin repeat domain-containing protein [Leptospiraceae bacterium]MBP9163196.1 ankyrin repeat domain-containing protein [Leptospiraceae bacterium]
MKLFSIKIFFLFIFSFSIYSMSRADDYLLFSAEKGHFEHTKKALKMGAFVNVRDKDGKTPLMFAVNSGKPDIVLLLILYGAGSDFAIRDYDGKTALMYAIENNHTKIIEMLKSHGATE